MDYIRTHDIKAALGSTGKDPSQIRYGSGKIYRLCYSNKIIWDVLRTEFSASNFTIGANGGDVASRSSVISRGKNALEVYESLGWTCSPTTIGANTSTKSVTHSITYTQEGTRETTTATCTQEGKAVEWVGYSYSVSVSSTSIADAAAGGSTLSLKVSGTLYQYNVYSDGTTTLNSSSNFSNVNGYITSGYVHNSIAKLSNGQVVVGSAQNNITSYRLVYRVDYYNVTVSGQTFSSLYSGENVYQAANTATDSYGTPTVTVTYGDVGANGSATSMTVTYSQKKTTSYTSGYPSSESTLSGTVSNTSTSGSVYIYSISSSNSANGGTVVTSGSSRGNVSANSLGYTAKDRSRVLTVTVTVRANGQNGSKSVDVYQAKNDVSSQFNAPAIGTVTVNGKAGANGISGATVSVAYTQTKTTTSTASGSKTEQVANTTTTSATISGSTVANNGRVSNGAVIADKLPAAASDEKHVFTITSVSITVNGASGSKSVSLKVYQEANKVTNTTTKSHTVSISPTSQSNVSSAGATLSFTVKDTMVLTDTYTSTATADRTANGTATVTINNSGYFGSSGTTSTSVTGQGTVTPTIPENTVKQTKTYTITVKDATDSSKTASATITQNQVQYVFTSNTLAGIGAAGGDMTLIVTSTRNGKKWAITSSNVSISGITANKITVSELSGGAVGEYSIVINVPANTSTSSRTFTVTATQPTNGATIDWPVTQPGATVAKKKVNTVCTVQFANTSYTSVSYSVYFDATNTSSYSGGTISNVSIQLNTKMDGTGNAIASKQLYSSLSVPSGTKSSTSTGTLNNSSGSSMVYFLVYFDNSLQYRTLVMQSPSLQ